MGISGKKSLRSQTDLNLDKAAYRSQREIPTDTDELERLLNEQAPAFVDNDDKEDYYEKRKELVNQLFTAASKVLTDIQYRIFSAYYVVGMSEIQIANSFHCTQPYVSIVLSASVKKIKKHLKITT